MQHLFFELTPWGEMTFLLFVFRVEVSLWRWDSTLKVFTIRPDFLTINGCISLLRFRILCMRAMGWAAILLKSLPGGHNSSILGLHCAECTPFLYPLIPYICRPLVK
eukprot:TRINITY_DN17705_c1_g1_i1.p1 TRINITY_DN17705_c1_g1~~TRINITY_DN17705_c1_g1_i1.p1  ORF type:complete len:107 (-),score=5.25 TRINITY_DN17705_c1_g1_i1:360-680(-)